MIDVLQESRLQEVSFIVLLRPETSSSSKRNPRSLAHDHILSKPLRPTEMTTLDLAKEHNGLHSSQSLIREPSSILHQWRKMISAKVTKICPGLAPLPA